MDSYKIGDLFNVRELMRAIQLIKQCKQSGESFHNRAVADIVTPVLPRIERKTGQKNDPDYLAYVLEHSISRFAK